MKNWILIDDDKLTNYVHEVILRKVYRKANILTFEDPREALDFINENLKSNTEKYVVFLDLNMPELSGWELLEELLAKSPEVLNSLEIYILSSSIDPRDINKAETHSGLAGFISKPLSIELIENKFNLN